MTELTVIWLPCIKDLTKVARADEKFDRIYFPDKKGQGGELLLGQALLLGIILYMEYHEEITASICVK